MLKQKHRPICGVKEYLTTIGAKLGSFFIIVLLLGVGCTTTTVYETDSKKGLMEKPPQMSREEARRNLEQYLRDLQGQVTNVEFSYIRNPAVGRKYFKFRELNDVYVKVFGDGHVYFNDTAIWFNSEERCKIFAESLLAMKYYASSPVTDQSGLADFKEKAKAWRALPTKPALPAEANRYRVLAEDAFKNKDFEKAIDYYDKALEAYPLWPQGQFNAALICGETGNYADAVGHMKRYLELAPEAKDAKAAQEKIFIWEEKAKQ